MRLGIMCHSSFGGSGRIALELALELSRRDHRVDLFTRGTPFGIWDPAYRVVLHRVPPDRETGPDPADLHLDWTDQEIQALTDRVLRLVKTGGLDVLHFHYALPFAFVAAAVKDRLGAAAPLLVGTLHGTDVSLYGRDPALRGRLARILPALDGLTTVSQSHARLAARVFGLARPPAVIPNFVDLSRFRPRALPARAGARDRPRVVHVSNFRPVKDPRAMAAIFAGIRTRLDAELWLVGDGPELGKVDAFFARRGLKPDVRLLGLCSQVAPLLRQADLLLMSSRTESFCLAALEAMACGIPVLATRVGGMPEVVVSGETGFLYPRGDQARAVDLAVQLLADPERRLAMGGAARRRARGFGQQQVVGVYETYYRTLLGCRRTRQPAGLGHPAPWQARHPGVPGLVRGAFAADAARGDILP